MLSAVRAQISRKEERKKGRAAILVNKQLDQDLVQDNFTPTAYLGDQE